MTDALPEWEDEEVQIVYKALVDPDIDIDKPLEDHWEGWTARHIVQRLRNRRAEPVSVQEAARVLLTAWEEDPTPIPHEVVVSIFNHIMGPDLREGFDAALRALAADKKE